MDFLKQRISQTQSLSWWIKTVQLRSFTQRLKLSEEGSAYGDDKITWKYNERGKITCTKAAHVSV